MKKLLLFAAVAGLGLVSASPPNKHPGEGARGAPRHYPPCSRTVRDRCIQLYERGVRAQPRGDRHARMEDHPDNGRRGHRAHGADHGADHHRAAGEHHARAEHHAGAGHHGPDHARGDHRNCPDHHARAERRVHVEHRIVHRVVRTAHVRRAAAQPRRHYAQRVRRAGERG